MVIGLIKKKSNIPPGLNKNKKKHIVEKNNKC